MSAERQPIAGHEREPSRDGRDAQEHDEEGGHLMHAQGSAPITMNAKKKKNKPAIPRTPDVVSNIAKFPAY